MDGKKLAHQYLLVSCSQILPYEYEKESCSLKLTQQKTMKVGAPIMDTFWTSAYICRDLITK